MRVRRFFRAAAVGTSLLVAVAACGSSSNKGTAIPAPKSSGGGMSAQDMKCMDKHYAGTNPKRCPNAAPEAKPYTLAKPLTYAADGIVDPASVDLSGVAGVGRAQQKEAENLLVSTIKTLPQWNDIEKAKADGFQSIGDGPTGEEHLLHWDWINDNTMFDPTHPESLVYKVDPITKAKTLEAAMYILPEKYTLDNPPSIDSPLVQFHFHNNLCFTAATPTEGPQVRGLTDASGNCGKSPFDGQQLTKFNPNIQVHVWIRKNDCGPFAALLGVGAGQIKGGTERSCIMDHTKVGL